MPADPVAVRHPQGLEHGFLVLRDLDDRILAAGDVLQVTNGTRVTAELVFHFKDGSLHDETAVFSQRRVYRLLSYHLVQKGKSFSRQTDLSFNAVNGQVTVHETDEDGKEKSTTDRLKLPSDVANGMQSTLLLDIDPKAPKTTLSMLVAAPKPRLVKLEVTPSGEDSFSVGGVSSKALCYKIKIDPGGVAGLIAPLIGKQPPEMHAWIASGKAPGFLKFEGPLYLDGPIWRIELASPAWPTTN